MIAAVLLLHYRSVDEIAPRLNAIELEQVITLVGRDRRAFTRATRCKLLRARGQYYRRRRPKSFSQNAAGNEQAKGSRGSFRADQPTPRRGLQERDRIPSEASRDASKAQNPPQGPLKPGQPAGTRDETARRRLIVEDCMRGGPHHPHDLGRHGHTALVGASGHCAPLRERKRRSKSQ